MDEMKAATLPAASQVREITGTIALLNALFEAHVHAMVANDWNKMHGTLRRHAPGSIHDARGEPQREVAQGQRLKSAGVGAKACCTYMRPNCVLCGGRHSSVHSPACAPCPSSKGWAT